MKLLDRRNFLQAGTAAALSLHQPIALCAQRTELWTFDNLQRIGNRPVTLEGQPKLVPCPWGKAVAFDGQQDALFIDHHPLAGATTFTFEALFRPDGGAFEQRWFHLQSNEGNARIMFEIRVVRDEWYLDAFMLGPGYNKALVAPEKRFPIGRWHHVAQTYDGTRYRSYVNAELQMEVRMPFEPQGAGRASIGTRMNRVSYFKGAVREARFTHASLRPSEFRASGG